MDYRRFFRQAMMLTITTGLLASCSKDNNVGEPEADEQLVSISPGIALSAKANGDEDADETSSPAMNQVVEGLTFSFLRADNTSSTSSRYSFQEGSFIGTCSEPYQEEGTNDIVAGLTFSPEQYYLINGRNTRMIGWYPVVSPASYSSTEVEIIFPINGKTDIMISDFQTGNQTDKGIKKFTFEHLLTQIQFQVTAESEIAAQQWGNVIAISLEEEATECSLLIENTDISPLFQTNGTLDAYLAQQEVPITYGENTPAGLIMIEERTISNRNTINLKITTTGKGEMTEAINLNDFINGQEFEAGYAYTLTLRFLQDEVEIKVTPADWRTPAGEVDVEVGNEYPYIKDGKYIISGDLLGSTGETFHDKWTATEVNTDETCVSAAFEIAESDATVDESSEVNWYIATGTHDETYNPDTKNACPEGWRLPTIKELELIETFNARLTHPLTENSGYWSATESAEDDGQAHILENNGGLDRQTTKSTVGKVRCVRDI